MVLIAGMLPPALRGVYRDGSERHERGRRALDDGWVRPSHEAPLPEAASRVVVG
jgi:hypothetical protein